MEKEALAYSEKKAFVTSYYLRYDGKHDLHSLKQSINAFENAVYKMAEELKRGMPIFSWETGNNDKFNRSIFRANVTFIEVLQSRFATNTQPVGPSSPPPPPHHPTFHFVVIEINDVFHPGNEIIFM